MASSIPRSSSVNTFDHNNTSAAQQPAQSSRASAHQPMSPAMFERALQDWVRQADETPRDNKQEAADLILKAYQNNLTELHLGRNQLTTLPIGLRESGFAEKYGLQDKIDKDGHYTGTRLLKNGVREEGKFKYVEKTKRAELIDGIVTKPNGTRKQLTNGHYLTLFGMKYKTTRLSPVAPLDQPAQPTIPTAEANPQPSNPTPNPPTEPTLQQHEVIAVSPAQFETLPIDGLCCTNQPEDAMTPAPDGLMA